MVAHIWTEEERDAINHLDMCLKIAQFSHEPLRLELPAERVALLNSAFNKLVSAIEHIGQDAIEIREMVSRLR